MHKVLSFLTLNHLIYISVFLLVESELRQQTLSGQSLVYMMYYRLLAFPVQVIIELMLLVALLFCLLSRSQPSAGIILWGGCILSFAYVMSFIL